MNKKHNLLQTPEERFRDENITNKIEITKSNLFNGRDNDGYIDLTPTFENIGELSTFQILQDPKTNFL